VAWISLTCRPAALPPRRPSLGRTVLKSGDMFGPDPYDRVLLIVQVFFGSTMALLIVLGYIAIRQCVLARHPNWMRRANRTLGQAGFCNRRHAAPWRTADCPARCPKVLFKNWVRPPSMSRCRQPRLAAKQTVARQRTLRQRH